MSTDADLSVFVSTFNRTDSLKRCLRSLKRQAHPQRVVIVDNHSTWDKAIDLLGKISRDYTIYDLPHSKDMVDVTKNINRAIKAERQKGHRPRWHAVTDADFTLDGPKTSIDTYIRLATALNSAVGPLLRLDPHPNYALRNLVMLQQSTFLYKNQMLWHGRIPYTKLPIDSTFHLFPAERYFRRLQMQTLRVGGPWWGTHLDWGIDFCKPSAEHRVYNETASEAASYGAGFIREAFVAFQDSPERAYELMAGSRREHNDYYMNGFVLSWMLQHGHGCEVDVGASYNALHAAMPSWSPCWEYQEDWPALVQDDVGCLGWGRLRPQ